MNTHTRVYPLKNYVTIQFYSDSNILLNVVTSLLITYPTTTGLHTTGNFLDCSGNTLVDLFIIQQSHCIKRQATTQTSLATLLNMVRRQHPDKLYSLHVMQHS